MTSNKSTITPAPFSSSTTSTRYIRDPEVGILTGLSRSTRWRLEAAGEFPRRHKLSARAVGWRAADVEEWMRQRSLQGGAR